MIEVDKHFISKLAQQYNQLYLPIKSGISKTNEYKDVVLRGKVPATCELDFILNEKDYYEEVDTQYGQVKYIYLYNREDFEKLVRKLAYKCEFIEIPKTMGATLILGIYNWEKVKLHKLKYELMGNNDWNIEFKRFTSVKKNYQDSLIIISDGYYSNLSYKDTNFREKQWKEISIDIRKYHEFTHFICINKYPSLKDSVFDEIVADCMGITLALGYYDRELACKCIGITKEGYTIGGRLENYVDKTHISQELCERVLCIMDKLEQVIKMKMDKTKINNAELCIDYLEYLIEHVYSQENILLQCDVSHV